MPKICYVERNFKPAALAVIEQANEIIHEYALQGFSLTLRQLYYQFVSRDLLGNTQRNYNNLGVTINHARLAGLIDWNSIVDRTRNLRSLEHWDSAEHILRDAAGWYQQDRWAHQVYRPEVWIEKDALVGVIESVCNRLDVPFFSCRGYTSQSELWSAAMRAHRYVTAGQTPYVIHLGDHDPSGVDMTRDIADRFKMFMGGCEVNRIALNSDQVDEYSPPPNPAKITDTRARAYIAKFGSKSWELDALEPSVISDLIEGAILNLRDEKVWSESEGAEQEVKDALIDIADQWEDVVEQFA